MTENSLKKKRKPRRGRPPKHGGYSLLTARGELPSNRKYIVKYLEDVRFGLIRDLGPSENDLTTAQRVLVDRIVCKLGIIRCIEEHIKENSVMVGDELASTLKASYLAYNNSVRLDLVALGIKDKAEERILTPFEIVEDEKKRKK